MGRNYAVDLLLNNPGQTVSGWIFDRFVSLYAKENSIFNIYGG